LAIYQSAFSNSPGPALGYLAIINHSGTMIENQSVTQTQRGIQIDIIIDIQLYVCVFITLYKNKVIKNNNK